MTQFLMRGISAATLFVWIVTSISAAELHVSGQAQLDAAIAAAAPGDEIILANGIYGATTALVVELSCRGTTENPITFRAASPGGVTLTGESHILITGAFIVVHGLRFDAVQGFPNFEGIKNVVRFVGATRSRLTQCYFYRCGWYKWAHLVQLYNGSSDNRVDHNTFEKIRGQGVGITHSASASIAPSLRNRIDHNYFNATEPLDPQNPVKNGNEPIQLGQGSWDDQPMEAVVEYNLIENMRASDGADPELISVKTADNIVRFNTCRNNDPSREITLRDAQRCIVEGNFMLGSGIRVYGSGHTIINNYISDAERAINLPGADGADYPATTDCLVANNTILNPKIAGISLRAPSGNALSEITLKNNLVQGGVTNSTLYYQQVTVTGTIAVANLGYNTGSATISDGIVVAVQSNPNLTVVNGVSRLPSGMSAAKNAGVAETSVIKDMDGQPRGTADDIGADRYMTGSVGRSPLFPADVGPAWLGGPPDTCGFSRHD